jgi:hypothetical protein
MNNSFPRLVDGVCTTLRTEVLTRIDDEYARSQVYGVINLLNTFKLRADWSAGFLVQQIEAQRTALATAAALLATAPATTAGAPSVAVPAMPLHTSVAELLATRDQGNRAIGQLLAWLDEVGAAFPADDAQRLEQSLRDAMRAEVDIELKNSPRPMFAEMSGAAES